MVVEQHLDAKSLFPYEGGEGGRVLLAATGNITINSSARVSTHADGRYSFGGSVELNGRGGVVVDGTIEASGGSNGGDITIGTPSNVTIAGTTDARGTGYGGTGGLIRIRAGLEGTGTLWVGGTVDAGGGSCNSLDGCGLAGEIALEGCNLTIPSGAMVDARAPEGNGDVKLIAHQALTVAGSVTALRTGSGGVEGRVEVRHRIGELPGLGGSILPPPVVTASQTCTGASEPVGCLSACPLCGDGSLQFPESCDDGQTADCDGCTRFCRLEQCDDNDVCTTDSCVASFGCRNSAIQGCTP